MEEERTQGRWRCLGNRWPQRDGELRNRLEGQNLAFVVHDLEDVLCRQTQRHS